jgi:Mg2+ and Co2+ transporter CorA
MMTFYGLHQGRLVRLDHASASGLPAPASTDVLWIVLLDPSRDDEREVETMLGVAVPTRQEMAEIEESARLYEERGALVMTAVVINGAAEGRPSRAQVTFVLTPTHVVSVRYADPVPFRTFEAKCQRQLEAHTSGDLILVSLLESIVERAAPSVGSVGDSYDNALAETINGLFKAEVIHRRGPWRSFEAVEFATLEWVDWFNNRRLLEPIGNVPPAEAETRYHAQAPALAA